MKVQSFRSNGMEVSPTTYNACTFQIIEKWDPKQYAKTCDTMFYLKDGTGAYVWDCDHWTFLDFTGVTQSDWAAKQNEAGYIKNKPFTTLGNGLSVDEKGVLNVNLTLEPIMYTAYANSADGTDGFTTVYPNLNLLTDSKDFKNKNVAVSKATTSITSPESTIFKEGTDTCLKFVKATQDQDWFRAYLIRGSSVSPNFPNVDVKPNTQYTFSVWLKGTGTHQIIAYNKWTNPNPTTLTVNLTDAWTKYVLTVNTGTTIPTQDAQFFIRSGTVGSEINLKYPKVEEGSTVTPWMPSASEVTTADWPKYAGHYASLSKEQSLDPKKYIWDSSETNTVNSVNGKSKDVILKGTDIIVSADDSRTVSEAIKDSLENFVHKEGDEVIGGNKMFTGSVDFTEDVDFKKDRSWGDLPSLIPSGWEVYFTNSGYQIRDKTLTINIYAVGTQKALEANTNTNVLKIPNVTLPTNFTGICNVLPGEHAHTFGKWTILKDGTVQLENYEAVPAQTGENNNHFNCKIQVPIL